MAVVVVVTRRPMRMVVPMRVIVVVMEVTMVHGAAGSRKAEML